MRKEKQMDEEKRTLGLRFGKIEPSDDGRSFGFEAKVVEVTADEKIRNAIGKPYEDLGIHCYISKTADYGNVTPEYRSIHSANLRRVEAMAKLLKQIHRRLDAHRKKFGPAADAADAFMRVAHAIGVKVYVIPEGVSRGWSYDDQEHRLIWDHDIAAGIIRRMFREACQPAEEREVA